MSIFSIANTGLSPHDALFKSTFSDPQNALVLLKAVAAPVFAGGFQVDSIEPEHVSFVDEELEQKRADLLFRAVINSSETFVYLLFDHLSQISPIMSLRMYRYARAALQRAYTQQKELPLPELLPDHRGASQQEWLATRYVYPGRDGHRTLSGVFAALSAPA